MIKEALETDDSRFIGFPLKTEILLLCKKRPVRNAKAVFQVLYTHQDSNLRPTV